MAATVRFQVSQKELDASNNISDEKTYTYVPSFTVFCKNEFSMVSGNVWKTIDFGSVATSSAIRIETDNTVTIRMNGGSEAFTVTLGMIFVGEITALDVKNNSGNTANVTIEIYGS